MNNQTTYTSWPREFAPDFSPTTGDISAFVRGATTTAAIVVASLSVHPVALGASESEHSLSRRTLPRIEYANLRKKSENSTVHDCETVATIDHENFKSIINIFNSNLQHIDSRINEISALKNDWDGDGSIAPTALIMSKTKRFLQSVPSYYLQYLNSDDAIYPTTYGTITVEWRPNDDNVVSVEIGQTTFNFYAILDGQIIKSDASDESSSILSQKLGNTLQKIFALYYEPSTIEC